MKRINEFVQKIRVIFEFDLKINNDNLLNKQEICVQHLQSSEWGNPPVLEYTCYLTVKIIKQLEDKLNKSN